MPRPDMARNLEHYHNPQESDVWSEMMCVYHIVLGVTENDRLIIAEKDKTVMGGQTFDFVNAKEISKEEHCKLITYSGNVDDTKGPTFVADVMIDNHIAKGMVETWKKVFNSKYITYDERHKSNQKKNTLLEELGLKLRPDIYNNITIPIVPCNYRECGYRVIRTLKDIDTRKNAGVVSLFDYKGYQIAFSTVKREDTESPRKVSIWKGSKLDEFVDSVDTVQDAISVVDTISKY